MAVSTVAPASVLLATGIITARTRLIQNSRDVVRLRVGYLTVGYVRQRLRDLAASTLVVEFFVFYLRFLDFHCSSQLYKSLLLLSLIK